MTFQKNKTDNTSGISLRVSQKHLCNTLLSLITAHIFKSRNQYVLTRLIQIVITKEVEHQHVTSEEKLQIFLLSDNTQQLEQPETFSSSQVLTTCNFISIYHNFQDIA